MTEGEAETAEGVWGGRKTRTATAWDAQESGAGEQPGVVTAGGSETGKANSVEADKAGAGVPHGVRAAAEERVAGQQVNPVGECYGVGGGEEGREDYGVVSEPSGVR